MTPRRILYFLNSSVRGGVEEHVLSLIAGLSPQEFSLALACPEPLLGAMERDLARFPVRCYGVTATGWTQPGPLRRLAGIVREFEPSIVHTHLFRATLVGAPLAKMLRVPGVVETYHGREAWRRGLVKGSFVVDRFVSRWIDRVIAVSSAAAAFLVERKGVSRDKVVVIPNGRDLAVYRASPNARTATRAELQIPDDAPVIGVVGRLDRQKGHRYFFDALPSVLREFPNARALVVGDGALRAALEEQVARLELQRAVRFTGFQQDVSRFLAAMDIVVLPSLHEGMPLTAIEAAAAAKPVIATAVDGTPEVVRHGQTGLLVEAAMPLELTAAMLKLLRNPGLTARLGRQAEQVAQERFDVRRQVDATATLYRNLPLERRP